MEKVREHYNLQYDTNNKNNTNTKAKATTCNILYNSLIQITCAKDLISIISCYSKYNISFYIRKK